MGQLRDDRLVWKSVEELTAVINTHCNKCYLSPDHASALRGADSGDTRGQVGGFVWFWQCSAFTGCVCALWILDHLPEPVVRILALTGRGMDIWPEECLHRKVIVLK